MNVAEQCPDCLGVNAYHRPECPHRAESYPVCTVDGCEAPKGPCIGACKLEPGPHTNVIELGTTPLEIQVGGDHYKKLAIQPVEYIHANGIPFIEGCVIKYMTRWRDKGGVKDLQKAKHFIDLLIQLEAGK